MATADQAGVRRIEELVNRIGNIPDPDSREAARQLMESILELHGAGLERVMAIASEAGDPGQALIRRFSADPLIAALLILHDLHPDDLETRVQHAIGKWHGSVELVSAWDGAVRVRVAGGACGMREAVEAAIREAAPDATEITLEESFQPVGFIPLSALGAAVPGGD